MKFFALLSLLAAFQGSAFAAGPDVEECQMDAEFWAEQYASRNFNLQANREFTKVEFNFQRSKARVSLSDGKGRTEALDVILNQTCDLIFVKPARSN